MGSTPRQHRYQLPMATRSTDAATVHECPGKWVLSNFYEKEKADASYFMLGSQLHETIECCILLDLDEDQAIRHLNAGLEQKLAQAEGKRIIETPKRSLMSMAEDAERLLGNWFTSVHPDSSKRHPIYDEYEWPPKVEEPFIRDVGTAHPIWGSIDVLWTSKGTTKHHAITDWKSGTSRQRSYDQLHFYRFGLGEGNIPAWYHRLDAVQARAMIQMAEDYPGDDAVRQRVLATEAIKQAVLDDGRVSFNPGPLCNYCPVQEFCPSEGKDRKKNLQNLESMLGYARPLVTDERSAS